MSRRRGQPAASTAAPVPPPAPRRDRDPGVYFYPEPEGCRIMAMPATPLSPPVPRSDSDPAACRYPEPEECCLTVIPATPDISTDPFVLNDDGDVRRQCAWDGAVAPAEGA